MIHPKKLTPQPISAPTSARAPTPPSPKRFSRSVSTCNRQPGSGQPRRPLDKATAPSKPKRLPQGWAKSCMMILHIVRIYMDILGCNMLQPIFLNQSEKKIKPHGGNRKDWPWTIGPQCIPAIANSGSPMGRHGPKLLIHITSVSDKTIPLISTYIHHYHNAKV